MSAASARVGQDRLAQLLLPALLHKLNNHTQLLSNLNTLLGMEGGEELVLTRGDDLRLASRSVHELGWLMAVLASGCGADMLLERRNPAGLRMLAGFLRESLRRRQGELVLPEEGLPDLAPGAADGWQVPWAFGTLVCARVPAEGEAPPVAVTCAAPGERWTLEITGGVAPALDLAGVRARLPQVDVESSSAVTRLALPAGWLRMPE